MYYWHDEFIYQVKVTTTNVKYFYKLSSEWFKRKLKNVTKLNHKVTNVILIT